MAERDAHRRNRQAHECSRVFRQHGVGGRVLAAVHGLPERGTAGQPLELAQRDGEADALEEGRCAEHHVVPGGILQRLRMADVLHAFVKRDAAAEAENQHCDDQAPEVQLLAVPERVFGRGGPLAQADAHEQEHAVEAVDRRVNALREHGRTAGDAGHHELGGGDGDIGRDGRIDGQLR